MSRRPSLFLVDDDDDITFLVNDSEVDCAWLRSRESVFIDVLCEGRLDVFENLLGQFLAVRFPGYRLASANVGSLGGLISIRRGEAHLGGSHLLDPETPPGAKTLVIGIYHRGLSGALERLPL